MNKEMYGIFEFEWDGDTEFDRHCHNYGVWQNRNSALSKCDELNKGKDYEKYFVGSIKIND